MWVDWKDILELPNQPKNNFYFDVFKKNNTKFDGKAILFNFFFTFNICSIHGL